MPAPIFPRTFRICRAASPRGATPAEAERAIAEAIELHLEGMRRDGAPIPAASSHVEYVEIAAIDDNRHTLS
jgi:predicted RNase H-like HicB family nuclease